MDLLKINIKNINFFFKRVICALDIQRKAMKLVYIKYLIHILNNNNHFLNFFYNLSIFLLNKLKTIINSNNIRNY